MMAAVAGCSGGAGEAAPVARGQEGRPLGVTGCSGLQHPRSPCDVLLVGGWMTHGSAMLRLTCGARKSDWTRARASSLLWCVLLWRLYVLSPAFTSLSWAAEGKGVTGEGGRGGEGV